VNEAPTRKPSGAIQLQAVATNFLEGSANWTANPRTEQNILLNDRAAWEFHAAWLEEMFAKGEQHHG